MEENPRKDELGGWIDPWQPPPPARWRKIISTTIILTVVATSVGWSWYPTQFALAMIFLAVGVLIRYVDFDRRRICDFSEPQRGSVP